LLWLFTKTELLDLNNPDNAKFISALLYDCFLINGKKGKDPNINAFYFKYHGTKQEYENSKKELKEFSKKHKETISKLEKQAKNVPDDVNRIIEYFLFLGVWWQVEIGRKNVNSSNPQTLYNNHGRYF